MNTAQHVPFLMTMIRTRVRGRFMSLGIWAALVILVLGCFILYAPDCPGYRERLPETIVWVIEFVALGWSTVLTGIACRRERESGRLLGLRGSAIGAHQVLIGLLFGPAIVEWAVGIATAMASVVLRSVLPFDPHLHVSTVIAIQVFMLYTTLFVNLSVVSAHLPRPSVFYGYRYCVAVGEVAGLVFGMLLLAAVFNALGDPQCERAADGWFVFGVACLVLGLPVLMLGLPVVLLWAHTVSLLRPQTPGRWVLWLRLAAVPLTLSPALICLWAGATRFPLDNALFGMFLRCQFIHGVPHTSGSGRLPGDALVALEHPLSLRGFLAGCDRRVVRRQHACRALRQRPCGVCH